MNKNNIYYRLIVMTARQLVIAMSLNAVLSVALWAKDGYSQDLENCRVSIDVQDADLPKIFSSIEEQTSFKFVYNEQVGQIGSVTLHAVNEPLLKVLMQLKQIASVRFKQINNMIAIAPVRQAVGESLSDVCFPKKENIRLIRNFSAFMQTIDALPVTGKVVDETGAPMPGVNVVEKGTTNGTVTDVDGKYSLSTGDEAVLVFTFVGYLSQEIAVDSKNTINVTLVADQKQLDEVVVVGYGTQKRRDLTSSISVVDAGQLQKRQTTTIAESLQGLAAGVNVRAGGQPGQEAKIEIRGLKNLQNANPLYVIDGLITNADRDFNQNDVESIQILKDAAASAIYGSRAANGVIIITTKKGKKGPLKFEVSSRRSITKVPTFRLAKGDEFVQLTNMADDNAGLPRQNLNLNVATDWQEEVFRTGVIQDHNINFSGGGENASLFMSANYFGNKGTVIDTDFDRLSFRINTSGKRGIFSAGENVSVSNSNVNETGGPELYRGNPFVDVTRMFPTIPMYDSKNPGGYGYGKQGVANTFAANPVAIANLIDQKSSNFRMRGNIWAEIQPLSSLKYRFSFGYDGGFDNSLYLRRLGSWTLNQPDEPSVTNQSRGKAQRKLFENTLTFSKELGKHDITIIAGTTYQQDAYEQISGSKRNLLMNTGTGAYFNVLDLGDNPQVGGSRNESVLVSYLGRLEYNYDNRYLLNAVFRRDGSSRFSDANKWSNFPSVSAAWRLSKEEFFRFESISDLKLRASYGELGSGNIGEYEYLSFINAFGASVFGTGQNLNPAATQVKLSNTNLEWEKLKQTNIGIDLGFCKNKLAVTADYYIARTENVLFGFPILMSTGNDGGNPISNSATVQNKGFEINIGYADKAGADFNYNGSINFTTVGNKLVSLGNGLNDSFQDYTVTTTNQPVGMWYLLQTDGIFKSQEEINKYVNSKGAIIQSNAKPGDIRFKDTNDDGQITNDDKSVLSSPWPKFETGLNGGFTYKNFDFSMNWIASFGATVYNGYRTFTENVDGAGNYTAGIRPWTPENPNADIPRALNASTLNARRDTDRWLENGSFGRLKYVGIGYNFPKALTEKAGITHARVSFSAQNILTITKYKGLDPEFSNTNIFQRGVDFGAFPNVQTYSLGVGFGF